MNLQVQKRWKTRDLALCLEVSGSWICQLARDNRIPDAWKPENRRAWEFPDTKPLRDWLRNQVLQWPYERQTCVRRHTLTRLAGLVQEPSPTSTISTHASTLFETARLLETAGKGVHRAERTIR